METTSKDGTKDLITGLIVLVVFSLVGYIGLTNVDLILDNALLIIITVFALAFIVTVAPRIVDMINSPNQAPSDPEQQPEQQLDQQPDQIKMETELEDFT